MSTSMRAAVAAATVILSTGAAVAQTKWDMPTPYSEGTFHTKIIRQFAEDVSKATGGKLTIQVHPAGSLFKHPEIKSSVRRGLAPIGEMLASLASNESPIFGVDSVPFLTSGYADARKLYAAQRPFLEKRLTGEGLMLLYSVPWPPQGLYSRKEIKTIEDLAGLKFRTYNSATSRMAQLIKAVPAQIEVPDIPTAFQTGRVESMVTSAATGVDSKAWDFLTHYLHMQAWQPRNIVIINKAAFDKLPADQQAALLEAGKKAEARGWEMSESESTARTKQLAENKITVYDPSPALKAALVEIGKTMIAEWEKAAGADGTALLKAYREAK